jgi:N-acetylglucosamine-6-phosphate deacetylase
MKPRSITGRDALTGKPLRIVIESDRIQSISPGPEDETAWLAAGLIDLQVNGYGGCDLNADTIDTDVVISLVQRLAATGVTTFAPTIITAPEEKIVRALRVIAQARDASSLAAHAIPFVHVEGPFISPEDGARGAHRRDDIRPPSIAEFERWQAACGGLVGMVTFSPHWENALAFIDTLAAKGIHIALGHTHAAPERIHAAAAAGATLCTHLGNGIAAVLPRHPNPIWAQLAEDRLTATFIADGHHLPADTLKAMLRAKTVPRSILVSDATALAGMPPGVYRAAIGGDVQLHADGSLKMIGPGLLAGAALPLKDGVANCASSGICSLADAIRMSTENPGRLADARGVLRPGAFADIIRFALDTQSRQLMIETVLIEGVEQQG